MALSVPLADRVRKLQALDWARSASAETEVPAAVRQAGDEALERGETHYTDRPGILPLREKVAAKLFTDYGVQVNAKSGVVITCGVTEARFVAVQQLVPTGGTVVAPAGGAHIEGACVIRGVELISTADGTDNAVLYLAGDQGVDTDSWLELARERGWVIIFEAGGDDTEHPAGNGLAEQTVTIGAIGADSGMESWRLGYLAAPDAKTGPLRDFKQALTICTTNVSQWGALALGEGEL